jgi:hypothetical protein
VAVAFAFAAVPAAALDCWTPFAAAPLLAFAVEFAWLVVFAAWPEREGKLPLVTLGPLLGAAACCGGLAGGLAAEFAAVWGGLGGADAPASSKAANGCGSVFWLGVVACMRDDNWSEPAAGKSDAILDRLDTLALPEAT